MPIEAAGRGLATSAAGRVRADRPGARPRRGLARLRAGLAILTCMALAACGGGFGQEPGEFALIEVKFASETDPPTLAELQELGVTESDPRLRDVPPLVRDALRDAALSLGAQAGLAWRSNQINLMLESLDDKLSENFPFAPLTIRAPNGGIVLPPVVSEAIDAYQIAPDGQSAARADRVYTIAAPGRLVGVAPTWRDYLVRTWGIPRAPNPTQLPKSPGERILWRQYVEEGWQSGIAQADEIFSYDLARLERDLQGMARYRLLVSQGIVTEIYFSAADKGVTGGGDELRVGERVVRIASPAQLTTRTDTWAPIPIELPPNYPLGVDRETAVPSVPVGLLEPAAPPL